MQPFQQRHWWNMPDSADGSSTTPPESPHQASSWSTPHAGSFSSVTTGGIHHQASHPLFSTLHSPSEHDHLLQSWHDGSQSLSTTYSGQLAPLPNDLSVEEHFANHIYPEHEEVPLSWNNHVELEQKSSQPQTHDSMRLLLSSAQAEDSIHHVSINNPGVSAAHVGASSSFIVPNAHSQQVNNYWEASTRNSIHQGSSSQMLIPGRAHITLRVVEPSSSSAQLNAAGYYPGEREVERSLLPNSLNYVPLIRNLDTSDDPRLSHSSAVSALNPHIQDQISKRLFAGKLRWFDFPINDDTLQSFQYTAYRFSRYIPPLVFPGTEEAPWPQTLPELLIAKHRPRFGSMMNQESGNIIGTRQYLSVWSTARVVPPSTTSERLFYGIAWIAPQDYAIADAHFERVSRAFL